MPLNCEQYTEAGTIKAMVPATYYTIPFVFNRLNVIVSQANTQASVSSSTMTTLSPRCNTFQYTNTI